MPIGGADGYGARMAAPVEEHNRITGPDTQHSLQVARSVTAKRTGVSQQLFGFDQASVHAVMNAALMACVFAQSIAACEESFGSLALAHGLRKVVSAGQSVELFEQLFLLG